MIKGSLLLTTSFGKKLILPTFLLHPPQGEWRSRACSRKVSFLPSEVVKRREPFIF